MHNNKLVAAIKHKGKVLAEFKDQVRIPFGSEYTVYIKNLNSVRALVSITIDGKDIGDGTKFIVQPNSDIEIERFLKNGNMNEGNRLKFIERNAKVEEARGIEAEDGLLRVEFQFEKPAVNFADLFKNYKQTTEIHHHHHHDYYKPYWYGGPYYGTRLGGVGGSSSGVLYNSEVKCATAGAGVARSLGNVSNVTLTTTADSSVNHCFVSNSEQLIGASAQANEAGITVEGSVSEQKFQTGAWFDVETVSHVIVLRLFGGSGKTKVVQAVTSKAKQKCKTCKHVNKVTAKFCSECGTGLTIV